MIAWLQGPLLEKQPGHVVLNVGGVGYRVFIALSTYTALPELLAPVTLHIVTHVRDDAIQLYGFLRPEERELFNLLNGITGIGSRLALAALSTYTPDELVGAILHDDVTALARIPGVGRKIGQRMVLELKDRIGTIPVPPHAGASTPDRPVQLAAEPVPASLREQLISALVNFGYRRQDAEAVIRKLTAEQPQLEFAAAIRLALQQLSPLAPR
jgi:Holliday junction DNA helicase RuvA